MSPERKKGSKETGKGKGPGKGTSPTARRQQKRREEKLALVQEQIADGSLKIRKMTPAERKKYPPRTKREDKRGK